MTKFEFERKIAPTMEHLWPKRFSAAPADAIDRWYTGVGQYEVDVVQAAMWSHADETISPPTPGRIAARIQEQLGSVAGSRQGPSRPDSSWAEVQRRFWQRELGQGVEGAQRMSDEEVEKEVERLAQDQGCELVRNAIGSWTGQITRLE